MTEQKNDALKKLERDWRSMIFISHDFFHRWRLVLAEKYGQAEADDLVVSFWESVGVGTGEAYLKKGRDPENMHDIVEASVRASLVMGESAKLVQDGDDYLLVHDKCPWIDSFKEYGAPGKCQAGCDKWFEAALRTISPKFAVKTESCLASGDSTCTRRYYKVYR
ncbi:MAG: L-2-amino-thiazoline-4-carboxylic acid hydrolase [Thermincola sp.]|jgi:hypothetical protein|nr:L-2-amino-thiazoline-4-carboxylic acid hydrolase [Thermincola sp.]MDT3703043.1 L-2-amino-thiazoline-4-carboxylic acid hydrolase [Thermincola sp.]